MMSDLFPSLIHSVSILYDIIRRLADLYGLGADEWERVITRTWFYLTPPTLILAVLIMAALITRRRRWPRRMSRASFGLLSSYAAIMIREMALHITNTETLSQPWALLVWTYAFFTVSYFLYALITEWVFPFFLRRSRKDSLDEDGFDEDSDDTDDPGLGVWGIYGGRSSG